MTRPLSAKAARTSGAFRQASSAQLRGAFLPKRGAIGATAPGSCARNVANSDDRNTETHLRTCRGSFWQKRNRQIRHRVARVPVFARAQADCLTISGMRNKLHAMKKLLGRLFQVDFIKG